MRRCLSPQILLGLGVLLLALPVTAQADFIIEFTNGSRMTVSKYKEESATVKVYTAQGWFGFRKEDISEIIDISTDPRLERDREQLYRIRREEEEKRRQLEEGRKSRQQRLVAKIEERYLGHKLGLPRNLTPEALTLQLEVLRNAKESDIYRGLANLNERINAELEESRQRELMAEHEFARKYGQLEQTQ